MSDGRIAIAGTRLLKTYGRVPGRLQASSARRRLDTSIGPIDLAAEKGTGLAVVGRNGAGKSTLLRLLAGLARPTAGRVERVGRLGMLLELGAGFVDDWNGVENARAALRMEGLSSASIEVGLEVAREFADLVDFWERSTRTYSAGMRLRLAYALVVAINPDILIADEVLAVGDEGFQKRCSRHITEFCAAGGTLILATHNLYLAEKLCTDAIWLENGRVVRQGTCQNVTRAYRGSLEGGAPHSSPRVAASVPPGSTRSGRSVPPGSTRSGRSIAPGMEVLATPLRHGFAEPLEIRVPGSAYRGQRWLLLERLEGTLVARFEVGPDAGRIAIEGARILPGLYRLRLTPADQTEEVSAEPQWMEILECTGNRREIGAVYLSHHWHYAGDRSVETPGTGT
jgi:lipopolysaccharide transport system ATP-binding protein